MKKMVNKNKNSYKNLNFILLSFIFLSIFCVSFVVALHTITTSTGTTSYSILEDTNTTINITVNNTDAGQNANITQVNITMSSANLTFNGNTSNGTSLSAVNYTFVIDGRTLNWTNSTTYLLNGSEAKNFWINITADPGNYNITVRSKNSTSTYTTNISITVNDTTTPSTVSFQNQTPSNADNFSRAYIPVNITATDNVGISTIRFYLYNSTGLVNSTNSTSNPALVNFTNLADAIYYVNATVNDTSNNVNTSLGTRTITLDTTAPTITLVSPANGASTGVSSTQFLFNVSSDLTGIANCSLVFDGEIINTSTSISTSSTNTILNTSLSSGLHNWSIYCNDTTLNVGNSVVRSLTIVDSGDDDSDSSSSSGGSGGGGSYTPIAWKNTYIADDKELSEKGKITRDLAAKNRIRLKIKSTQHFVGVTSLSSSTATIEVSSTPQQATLATGETKKFDVNNDGYYDLMVKLNSISNDKANVEIQAINEKIPEVSQQATQPPRAAPVAQEPDTTATSEDNSLNENKNLFVIGIIVIIALIVLVGYYLMANKSKRNR